MIKKIILCFMLMFSLELFTTIFRGYMSLLVEDVLFSFLIYTLAIWLVIRSKWLMPNEALVLLSSTLLFTNIIGVLIDGGLPTVGAPNMVIQFVGLFTGYAFYKISKWVGLALLILGILAASWYIKRGHYYWFNYLGQESFTGVVNKALPIDWYFTNEASDTIDNNKLKGKTAIFDFWNTRCGVCVREFPRFDSLSTHYGKDSNLVFYAVNLPMDRDTVGQALDMYNHSLKKHKVPTLLGNKLMRQNFEINGFPTIIVLKDNTILFKGSIELFELYMKNKYAY